jgi:cysteinyl-tRNA synthetase
VEERQAARARRDWAAADMLRQQLASLGWQVQDTPDGPRLDRLDEHSSNFSHL